MAGDLLPALDPLLDPRSPAAQAALDRTSYSVRGRVGNPGRRVLRPRCRSGPRLPVRFRCRLRAAPARRASSDQAGGSAPSPLPSRRHSQGCTTAPGPASLAAWPGVGGRVAGPAAVVHAARADVTAGDSTDSSGPAAPEAPPAT